MNLIDVLFARALLAQSIGGEIEVLAASVPAGADVDAAGVVAFQNSGGTQLFTLQLPLYGGGVV
ncbi:MAG: hypothetical protein J5789_09290 [Oscillospiraceae bacterium]|nr:hypothetical protein [Oscillospiraceae bacterium]